MNCRRFQHRIYEFLDGTLSPRAQAAAEKHVAGCDACREAVEQQRQLARALSSNLKSSTESLHLPPAFQHRILAALASPPASRHKAPAIQLLWGRLAWRLAIAGCLLLVAVITVEFLHRPRDAGRQVARSQPHRAPPAAFIRLTYSVPSYTFHSEDSLVIDSLTHRINVVNATLLTDPDPKAARPGRDKKYSL